MWTGVYVNAPGWGLKAGPSEHGIKTWDFIKERKFRFGVFRRIMHHSLVEKFGVFPPFCGLFVRRLNEATAKNS